MAKECGYKVLYAKKKKINSAEMDNNVLDEFEINKEEIRVDKAAKNIENFYFLISGIIFGIGYLMLIINGYYHFKSTEFIQIGRQDLIARLGFLSYANGIIFYPTSIILIGIIIWIINQRKRNGIWRKLIFAILGLIIPGILFYGKFKLDLLFGPKEKWIIGIALIALSIFILKNKAIKI